MNTNVIESGFERVWQMFQETDRKFEESKSEFDRRSIETDRKFEESKSEFDRRSRETDQKFRESADQLKKIEGMFIGKWGRFMEVLVDSGAIHALREYGEPNVKHSATRVREEQRNGFGRGMEIDVLCWGPGIVVPVEVKTTLTVEYVKEHEERLQRFMQCFPGFQGANLHGAVAALHFNETSDRYAYKQGLYVMTLVGKDMVTIVNDKKFQPKEW
jgi:hypothetical protein